MLVIFAGPSGIGKDAAWLRLAEELGFRREVPFTTRPRRAGETDGYDYHFVRVDQFQEMIRGRALTDWDFALGNYYGTGLSLGRRVEEGEDVSLQALARMCIRLRSRLPNVRTIMLLTSESTVLKNRLVERGYRGQELRARLEHALEEETHSSLFDFVVPDADIMSETQVLRVLEEVIWSGRG